MMRFLPQYGEFSWQPRLSAAEVSVRHALCVNQDGLRTSLVGLLSPLRSRKRRVALQCVPPQVEHGRVKQLGDEL